MLNDSQTVPDQVILLAGFSPPCKYLLCSDGTWMARPENGIWYVVHENTWLSHENYLIMELMRKTKEYLKSEARS